MSYIVPRDIPKTCGECFFSSYSVEHNGLLCGLDENILCVKRDEKYAFCKLIEVKGTLFRRENAMEYLRDNPSKDGRVDREVTE